MELCWPIKGRISQEFGERPEYYVQWGYPGHPAIDISAHGGTPVHAAHSGELTWGVNNVLGMWCRIYGDWGGYTQYGHLQDVASPAGFVQKGDEIGLVGNTGNSTGYHLDFALRIDALADTCWKGRVDPLPYLLRGEVQVGKASLHWQRLEPWLGEGHAALGSTWLKIVDPREGPDPAPGLRKLLRFWTDSWDRDCIRRGRSGAEDYMAREMARWSRYTHWGYVVFELPNEPGCNSNEEIAQLREFTDWAIRIGHGSGFLICALNLPEGNPHDNGSGSPEVSRWKMHQLASALIDADYYGQHAYWSPIVEGPSGRAHAHRYAQNADWIEEIIGTCPPILLSECGCDGGVEGHAYQQGWQRLYSSPASYVHDVSEFMQTVEQDARVEQAFFFTAGYEPPWDSFNHDRDITLAIGSALKGAPSIGEQIGRAAQAHIIPLNPDAALEKAAASLGLMSAGGEFTITLNGADWRAQPFRSPGNRDWQYIAYCKVGEWDHIKWHRRSN